MATTGEVGRIPGRWHHLSIAYMVGSVVTAAVSVWLLFVVDGAYPVAFAGTWVPFLVGSRAWSIENTPVGDPPRVFTPGRHSLPDIDAPFHARRLFWLAGPVGLWRLEVAFAILWSVAILSAILAVAASVEPVGLMNQPASVVLIWSAGCFAASALGILLLWWHYSRRATAAATASVTGFTSAIVSATGFTSATGSTSAAGSTSATAPVPALDHPKAGK